MSDLNRVVVIGRATKDPALSYTKNGTAKLLISIANNLSKKNGDEWVDDPHYFIIQLWGKRAAALEKYIKKGSQLAVDGTLKLNRWEKDGEKKSMVFIEAREIQLLGSPKDDNQKGQQQSQSSSGAGMDMSEFEDDIPF